MAPSKSEIHTIFRPFSIQGSQSQFFHHVSDSVIWTIPGTSPLSRTYHSKRAFVADTVQFLAEHVMRDPLRLEVTNVVTDGPDGTGSVVEMRAVDAVCKDGLPYQMRYCWVLTWGRDEGGDGREVIVEVTAYLDTRLLTEAIERNFGTGDVPSLEVEERRKTKESGEE